MSLSPHAPSSASVTAAWEPPATAPRGDHGVRAIAARSGFASRSTFYAAYQVFTRYVADKDTPETSVVYSALVGTIVMSALVPFFWTTPQSLAHVLLLASLGAQSLLLRFAAPLVGINFCEMLGFGRRIV